MAAIAHSVEHAHPLGFHSLGDSPYAVHIESVSRWETPGRLDVNFKVFLMGPSSSTSVSKVDHNLVDYIQLVNYFHTTVRISEMKLSQCGSRVAEFCLREIVNALKVEVDRQLESGIVFPDALLVALLDARLLPTACAGSRLASVDEWPWKTPCAS